MANIRIPCLVGRSNKAGITSWYWQPSRTLREAGWEPVALGRDEGRAFTAARARNEEVERWKRGELRPAAIRKRQQDGTLGALIARYRKEVLEGTKPDGTRRLARSTAKVYATGLDRLDAWAGAQPLAFITPARVRKLRDANLHGEGIGHHPTHQLLKMGRTLFRYAVECDLIPQGSNPFNNFGLAQPSPRDVIWSPPARELMIATADQLGFRSIALAIMLGFAVGQREADLLSLTPMQYVALPEHMMQAEDYVSLAQMAHDGTPRGVRIRQAKTRTWIAVPVVGEVRRRLEANIATARAADRLTIILDDTRLEAGRVAVYAGEAGQTRFQRDFAAIREAAVEAAGKANAPDLAEELATLQFRDLRRTCVVYLGELGLDAHLIAAITGHDIDDTQRILKTYMPRTTGRAARAIVLATHRQAKEAAAKESRG